MPFHSLYHQRPIAVYNHESGVVSCGPDSDLLCSGSSYCGSIHLVLPSHSPCGSGCHTSLGNIADETGPTITSNRDIKPHLPSFVVPCFSSLYLTSLLLLSLLFSSSAFYFFPLFFLSCLNHFRLFFPLDNLFFQFLNLCILWKENILERHLQTWVICAKDKTSDYRSSMIAFCLVQDAFIHLHIHTQNMIQCLACVTIGPG